MIAGPFVSGYLYFIKFVFPVMTVDIYRMLVAASLILTLISRIRTRRKEGARALYSPQKTSVHALLMFVGMIVVGVSDIARMGAYKGAVSELVAVATNCVVLFLLIDNIHNDCGLYLFAIDVYRYTGVVVAVLACLEAIIAFELPSSRFIQIDYLEKYSYHPATSIFGNENNLSGYLLTVIAIVMWLMLCEPRSKKKILYTIELILLIIPGILADSTIFRLGMILFLVLSFIISLMLSKGNYGRLLDRILPTGAVACLMLFVFRTKIKEVFIKLNAYIIHGEPLFTDSDVPMKAINGDVFFEQVKPAGMGTVEIRKNLFIYGVQAAKKHIFFGYGPDSFQMVIKRNPNALKHTEWIVDPHNFIVELLVQYGGILLVLFLFICVSVVVKALKNVFGKRTDFSEKRIYIIVLYMLIALAVTTVMPSSFIKSNVYFLSFFLAVIGADLYPAK